jgi:hypothetical protein
MEINSDKWTKKLKKDFSTALLAVKTKLNSVAAVRKRTIRTERPFICFSAGLVFHITINQNVTTVGPLRIQVEEPLTNSSVVIYLTGAAIVNKNQQWNYFYSHFPPQRAHSGWESFLEPRMKVITTRSYRLHRRDRFSPSKNKAGSRLPSFWKLFFHLGLC